MSTYRFPKTERLKSRTRISLIFSDGDRRLYHPVLFQFIRTDRSDARSPGVLYGVTVSKKKAKRAVDRNRVKRQMREAYRLQRFSDLSVPDQQQISIMAVYIGELPTDYAAITTAHVRFKEWLKKQHTL